MKRLSDNVPRTLITGLTCRFSAESLLAAILVMITTNVLADTVYHCASGQQQYELTVLTDVVGATLRISGDDVATRTLAFNDIRFSKEGFSGAQLIPGKDDERVVSSRLFHYRNETSELIYITHKPATRLTRLKCAIIDPYQETHDGKDRQ